VNTLQTAHDSQWTVGRVLDWMTAKFSSLERATPRLDAQLLLGAATGLSRVQLYTRLDQPLTSDERQILRELVQRRVRGEPVAYILQQKEWHDLILYVDGRVLIPRPETETLYDLAQAWAGHVLGQPALIVDLCTGSGCLALALARRFPAARVIGVDISLEALAVCAVNQERAQVSSVEWVAADVCDAAFGDRLVEWVRLSCPMDAQENKAPLTAHPAGGARGVVLVSNPPYVCEQEWSMCDVEVRDFEPRLALVADDDGLSVAHCLLGHWQRLTEVSAGQPALFCMEGAEGHPARLAHSLGRGTAPLVRCSAQQHVREFPLNAAFAACDLEGRARFFMDSEWIP
jgi:release factor glutamine methyltransferase